MYCLQYPLVGGTHGSTDYAQIGIRFRRVSNWFVFVLAALQQPAIPPCAPTQSTNVKDYFKSPPISVCNFIQGKDPTRMAMLCIDLSIPLLMRDGALLVTDLSIHCKEPSYWTIERNYECRRIIFDELQKPDHKPPRDVKTPSLTVKSFARTEPGDALDIITGLTTPDDISLEYKTYKKLSNEPLLYAQVSVYFIFS